MRNNLTKQFYVLLSILALVLLQPGMSLAAPVKMPFTTGAIFPPSVNYIYSSSNLDITPQQHQQMQAVRQRRNREIHAVLNSSQQAQFAHSLKTGNSFDQALRTLYLRQDQQELIRAIIDFSNLKMKSVMSKFVFYKVQK